MSDDNFATSWIVGDEGFDDAIFRDAGTRRLVASLLRDHRQSGLHGELNEYHIRSL